MKKFNPEADSFSFSDQDLPSNLDFSEFGDENNSMDENQTKNKIDIENKN